MEKLFEPHRNLSDQINRNIIRSEIEGGVDLRRLPHQATLEIATRNHRYVLVMEHDTTSEGRAESKAWIAGHPRFCPEPVLVQISGSNWGGSMIKANYLGRGMHMEFRHPSFPGVIVTSAIVEIRMLSEAA